MYMCQWAVINLLKKIGAYCLKNRGLSTWGHGLSTWGLSNRGHVLSNWGLSASEKILSDSEGKIPLEFYRNKNAGKIPKENLLKNLLKNPLVILDRETGFAELRVKCACDRRMIPLMIYSSWIKAGSEC